MMKRKRTKELGKLSALLRGLLTAIVAFAALSVAATLILYLGDDPTARTELFSFGALLLSGIIAGFINSKMRAEGGIGIAVLSSLAFILLLFLLGIICRGGLPDPANAINYAIYVCLSAASAFLAAQKPKKRHR